MYSNIRRKKPGRLPPPPLPLLRGKYVDRINELRVVENERKKELGPLTGVDREAEESGPNVFGLARGCLGRKEGMRIELSRDVEIEVKNR